jgi:hypothetical protein
MMRQTIRHDESDRSVLKHMRPRVKRRIHLAGTIRRRKHTGPFSFFKIVSQVHSSSPFNTE